MINLAARAGVRPSVDNPQSYFDTNCGGYALRSLPRWNLDLGVHKTIGFWREGVGADLSFQITNVLNHMQPADPNGYYTNTGNLDASNSASFGTVGGQINTPRQMEFGIRVKF